MKLSSDEGRALAFVVGLIALAGIARVITRPDPGDVPPAAAMDAAALEAQSESALTVERAKARPLGEDERIDVNGASAQELDRLPGVGPALAARLVAERERAGAYDSAADLRTVAGVGAGLLARIAPHVSFGPGEGLARRPPVGAGSADGESAGSRAAGNPGLLADGDAGGGRHRRPRSPRAPQGAAGAREPVPPSRAPALPQSPIDLNRASAEELDRVPGIGPVLAGKIVAKRDSLRGFRSLDDLLQVRGIGPATLQRLRPYFRS